MLVMIFMNSPNHFQATSDLLFHFPLILLKRILLWFDIYKLLCRMVNKLFLRMKIKNRAGHWSSLNCRVCTSLCQAIVILLIFVLWSAVREVETFISGLACNIEIFVSWPLYPCQPTPARKYNQPHMDRRPNFEFHYAQLIEAWNPPPPIQIVLII